MEEIKLSLFADYIIAYVENPKEYIFKTPRLISEFIKVVGYKIDIKKLIVFLYTGREHTNQV